MELTRHVRNQSEVVNSLKRAADENTLLLMVLKKFKTRVRNRNVLTPAALKLAMTKDGLNFPKSRYSEILTFLSSLGLGKLELGPRGQVRSLNRIPVDLRVIGEMVTGDQQDSPVSSEIAFPSIVAADSVSTNEMDGFKLSYSAHLVVNIKGQPVKFGEVTNLDAEDVGEFLIKFMELCRKYSK